jgi:hypothetical protein
LKPEHAPFGSCVHPDACNFLNQSVCGDGYACSYQDNKALACFCDDNKFCGSTCAMHSDCGLLRTCDTEVSRCEQVACTRQSDCPEGSVCPFTGQGGSQRFCSAPGPRAFGENCASWDQCAGGTCINFVCAQACAANLDCIGPDRCEAVADRQDFFPVCWQPEVSKCEVPCGTDQFCTAGGQCATGPACTRNEDCSAGMWCDGNTHACRR